MMVALNRYRTGKHRATITTGIAWINAWHDPARLRSFREFDQYWEGARAAADKLGYRLEEFRLDADCSPRRLHQILRARGIHAILLPPHDSHPDWGDFPWQEYSVVRFGRSLEAPACHVVTSDQVTNTRLAFMAMRERGYERIGFVTDEQRFLQRGHLFMAGFLTAQREVPESLRLPVFALSENAVRQDAAQRKRWAAAFEKWVRNNKPDAILTDIDAVADLMADIDLPVPGPIGLAVTSVLDAKADAGINQHPEEIGRVGVLLLHSLVAEASRGIPEIFRQILVEGKWVDGRSLPLRRAP
jgi:DNA-binding LacI/PurR family transcriptional regulator